MNRESKGGLQKQLIEKRYHTTTPDPGQTRKDDYSPFTETNAEADRGTTHQEYTEATSDVAGEKKEREDINWNKTLTSTQTMPNWGYTQSREWDTDYFPNRTSASKTG